MQSIGIHPPDSIIDTGQLRLKNISAAILFITINGNIIPQRTKFKSYAVINVKLFSVNANIKIFIVQSVRGIQYPSI